MTARRRDKATGVETTGHEWDGIEELDNPMPRWWLWVFLATIVWSIGYWVLMPSWPLVSGYTKGILGYSTRETVADDLRRARESQGTILARIRAASVDEIRTDPELLAFAIGAGRSAFAVNCSPCHGSGAAGAKGYPNLNDDDWLWGGTAADIERTIQYGIRSGHPKAHVNDMPSFVQTGMLTPRQASDAAEYVLSLSGKSTDNASAVRGQEVFAANCAACHGEDAHGNRELGAPNLADSIFLYGGDKSSLVATISNGRRGVMPAWDGRLDIDVIKELAVYVHALGGGE